LGIGENKITMTRWLVLLVGIGVEGENHKGMGLGWEKMGRGGGTYFSLSFSSN
jgi:hypothetical protein